MDLKLKDKFTNIILLVLLISFFFFKISTGCKCFVKDTIPQSSISLFFLDGYSSESIVNIITHTNGTYLPVWVLKPERTGYKFQGYWNTDKTIQYYNEYGARLYNDLFSSKGIGIFIAKWSIP